MLVSILGQRGVNILSDVMFVGMLITAFIGFVRVAYVKVYGAWPNNKGTRALAFLLELFSNVLGAFNKYRVASGSPPIFTTPEVDARDAELATLRARLAALEPVPVAAREGVLRATTLPQVPAVVVAPIEELPTEPTEPDNESEERKYQAAKRFVAGEVDRQ